MRNGRVWFLWFSHYFFLSFSVVTMPTSVNCLVNELKLNERISKFVIALGVVLQYTGAATYMAVAAVFVSRLSGIDLPWSSLFTLLIMIAIASMTMPHVPSASLFMLLILLTSINLDASYVSLLFAADWLSWVYGQNIAFVATFLFVQGKYRCRSVEVRHQFLFF